MSRRIFFDTSFFILQCFDCSCCYILCYKQYLLLFYVPDLLLSFCITMNLIIYSTQTIHICSQTTIDMLPSSSAIMRCMFSFNNTKAITYHYLSLLPLYAMLRKDAEQTEVTPEAPTQQANCCFITCPVFFFVVVAVVQYFLFINSYEVTSTRRIKE